MSDKDNESRTLARLEELIGLYPDFPKKGILFRDVMPILRRPTLFMEMIRLLSSKVEQYKPNVVLGIEARGFLIGPCIAQILSVPFVPIRKKGKLPGELQSIKYDLEYGQDVLEFQKNSLPVGSKCLIVDDLIATGGSMKASKSLIELSGSFVVAFATIIELKDLNGYEKLDGIPLVRLFSY